MHQGAVVLPGACREPTHQLVPARRGIELIGHQAVLYNGCGHRFKVVKGKLRQAVLRRQHLPLLGDFDATLKGATGLGQDGLICRSTATAHGTAATMKQAKGNALPTG